MKEFKKEIMDHLKQKIIPFWQNLIDKENGGYYSYMNFDLNIDKFANKGGILNSRILWFFSACYNALKDQTYLYYANHAYEFLKSSFWDEKYGGLYWMVDYKGEVIDETKHVYNQAFGIYALSEYYKATKDKEALELAKRLYFIMEEKAKEKNGYIEEFGRDWSYKKNALLSDHGVIASKTMNTHLHVLEAYTNLYRAWEDERLYKDLVFLINLFMNKIYDSTNGHFKVFCNDEWENIIEAVSYGHDIEATWLLDEAAEVIKDDILQKKLSKFNLQVAQTVLNEAFENGSLFNEKIENKIDKSRIWWVEAETVVGFLNAYQNSNDEKFLEATQKTWKFIKEYMVDKREGSEWYWKVDDHFKIPSMPIVEPWKCPYHNGRMCLEVSKRIA